MKPKVVIPIALLIVATAAIVFFFSSHPAPRSPLNPPSPVIRPPSSAASAPGPAPQAPGSMPSASASSALQAPGSEPVAGRQELLGHSDPAAAQPKLHGKFFSKMMDDPDTKEFMRDRQWAGISQLYEPLLKRLNLAPDESERLKQLLADRAVGTNSVQNSSDEQVKSLLGPTRYAVFADYQQTVSDRMQVNLFRRQLGPGERALKDEQAEKILNLIREEKQILIAAGQSLPSMGPDPARGQPVFSDEQAEKLLQAQENVNQRVYERARAVLSAEQLEAFARFQTNQLQALRGSMSMARSFLAPKGQ